MEGGGCIHSVGQVSSFVSRLDRLKLYMYIARI